MKKKITIKALLLLLVVALTSGCIKAEEGLKISNGSVEYTYTVGMMKSYLSMMTGEGDPFKDTTKDVKDSGFTVEDYDDGTYKGIKAVKKLGSLSELSTKDEIKDLTLSKDKIEGAKLFQITSEGFFKTTYKASFKTTAMEDVEKGINNQDTDFTTGGMDETEETGISPDEADDEKVYDTDTESQEEVTTTGNDDIEIMLKQMMDKMVVNFKVELPSTPGKNNATKVDGKTLIWDLKTIKDGTIEFEFTTLNMTNVFLVGGGALLLLVIIIAIILMITRKGKPEEVEYAEDPVTTVVKDDVTTPIGEANTKVEATTVEEETV